MKALNKLGLTLVISASIVGCDGNNQQASVVQEQQAVDLFKQKMDEGNKLSAFTYSNLSFRPDNEQSKEVISGWVCGDAELTHSQGTFHFKSRGHVLKTGTQEQTSELAALPINTGVLEHDNLYKKHCQ